MYIPLPASVLPSDHPLRSASWIWPEGYMYVYNCHAQFRHDFQLVDLPAAAPLFITADKAYKLWVNGLYVCRGPARGYQEHWPFDEVDVRPFLRPGHNWLAVEGYNPGIGTFQYQHRSLAGFLCAVRWGDFSLATNPKDWHCRRAPGRKVATARYSLQIDFQEHADARADHRDWIGQAEYAFPATHGWDTWYAPYAQHWTGFPFGRPPWDSVEPRGIPLLHEELLTPVAVTATAEGACATGHAEWENVAWGWWQEAPPADDWGPGNAISAKAADGWFEIELPATGAGRFRAAVIDCGRMLVGNVLVEAEGATGGEIVDFHHDPCLRSGKPAFMKPGDGCSVAMGNRLRLAPGQTAHEFYHLLSFRHLTVIARNLTQPLRLRLRVRTAGYPFTMTGTFRGSDETLNRIHDACRLTQQLCSLDAYVDTPWREQAQWWGDARVQARNTFYLDGDARLLARGVRSLAGQRTTQGLTYGHAPTIAYNCILPDFSLTWILTIRDYWWQTGDISLFAELWPEIQKVLAYFDTPEARHTCGLLRHDRRFWYFGDWAELYKGEIPTFLNLWYLLVLRETADLLRAAGLRIEGKLMARHAKAHEKLIRDRLFDREAQLFRDGLDEQLQPVARWSVHEQTLALILGLEPEAHATMLEQRLVPYLRGEATDGARPSAFWSTYTIEEAGRRGFGAEAIRFIREKWAPMLSTGTTWEDFTWQETGGGSCSHAWTAHPSYHFVNILAGIRQTAPAWAAIEVAPLFLADLQNVGAVVPAPPGHIVAAWRREGADVHFTLELPPGVKARVHLPGRKPFTVARPGTHVYIVNPGK